MFLQLFKYGFYGLKEHDFGNATLNIVLQFLPGIGPDMDEALKGKFVALVYFL